MVSLKTLFTRPSTFIRVANWSWLEGNLSWYRYDSGRDVAALNAGSQSSIYPYVQKNSEYFGKKEPEHMWYSQCCTATTKPERWNQISQFSTISPTWRYHRLFDLLIYWVPVKISQPDVVFRYHLDVLLLSNPRYGLGSGQDKYSSLIFSRLVSILRTCMGSRC